MSRGSGAENTLSTVDPSQKPPGENVGGVFRLDALSTGGGGASETYVAPKPKLSSQTLMLAVLLVAGGGLVYGMRLLGVGPLKNIASATIPDYDMTKTGVSKTSEHKKALEDLNANHTETQVPADQVQKNPFKLADSLSKQPQIGQEDTTGKQSAERARRDAEMRKRKIADAMSQLKVNSILGGSNPVARINGEFVRVGEVVNDVFTVTAIHGRSVDLQVDNQVISLTMDEDINNNKAGKKSAK